MKTKLAVLALTALTGVALAAPQTFDFKDPNGIINAGFKLDAPLESINGSANGVSGTVTIQAVAVAPGYLASPVASAAYTITSAPTAVISTVAGSGVSVMSGAGGPEPGIRAPLSLRTQ